MRYLLLLLMCCLLCLDLPAGPINPTVRRPKARRHQLAYWFGKAPVAARTKKWGLSYRYNK